MPELKPCGVERDKQIAELRGDKKLQHMTMFAGRPEKVDWYYKPYSTDIATAMELWEEMKGANLRPSLTVYTSDDGEHKLACEARLIADKPITRWREIGETEADAISGAWLKWRAE
jgi:hypothetical protein